MSLHVFIGEQDVGTPSSPKNCKPQEDVNGILNLNGPEVDLGQIGHSGVDLFLKKLFLVHIKPQ